MSYRYLVEALWRALKIERFGFEPLTRISLMSLVSSYWHATFAMGLIASIGTQSLIGFYFSNRRTL